MAGQPIPIANGFYVSNALPISAQRCVNFIPNVPETDTITEANLFSAPGLMQILSVSDIKNCRGAHVMDEIPYFVIGQTLYRLNRAVAGDGTETFTTSNLGTIAGSERVTMADNGTELCVCAHPDVDTTGKSYIFTASPDTLTEITDANFDGPAESVQYVDGLFVFTKANGKKFFNSPVSSGLGPYDALDFSTASADPDQIRAQAVYNNQLYIFGSETIEIFQNTGRSPAPFQRVAGAVIQLGISAPMSIQLFSDALFFIGNSANETPSVWAVAGGRKTKISTHAIDNELAKLTASEIESIYSWKYGELGNYFYSFTTPATTFVFDSATKRWHERQSIVTQGLTKYRVSHMITAYGRILVGDSFDGRIGELQSDLYTEYNNLVKRFITTRPFDNNGDPLFIAMIEAVCESGVGLTSDVTVYSGVDETGAPMPVTGGSDPQITLAWSDDGGRTFVGYLNRSLGKIGEYKRRQQWRKVGRFPRSRVLLLEIASPTKSTIAKAEVTLG